MVSTEEMAGLSPEKQFSLLKKALPEAIVMAKVSVAVGSRIHYIVSTVIYISFSNVDLSRSGGAVSELWRRNSVLPCRTQIINNFP